jgi:hypothetical protein
MFAKNFATVPDPGTGNYGTFETAGQPLVSHPDLATDRPRSKAE